MSTDKVGDVPNVQAQPSVLPYRVAWVTYACMIVCAAIFLRLALLSNHDWDSLYQWGYADSQVIWQGSYWYLITSAFVHLQLWHLVFNLYWLWALGGPVEKIIGSPAYFLFIMTAAFVSSAAQLGGAGDTGIGFSGIGYAIFGCVWISRSFDSRYDAIIDDRVIWLFLVWLIAGIALTYNGVLSVGNGAHFGGLLYGVAIGASQRQFSYRWYGRGLAAALLGLSVVPLLWMPWSVDWLAMKAYECHEKQDYQSAVVYYSRIISLESENVWAIRNRGMAYRSLGMLDLAKADAATVAELDSHGSQLP